MCTPGCIDFVRLSLDKTEVEGRRVLEVGSRDHNGSVRTLVKELSPREHLGVDLEAGAGVDVVCDAGDLVARFGKERFNVVISTEMLEHVRDWRGVVSNLKNVVCSGGVLILTTRSRGFGYHGCPFDYWRFEESDVRHIFSDMTIERIQSDDPRSPGIFIRARKPEQFDEADLSAYELYSILYNRRRHHVTSADMAFLRVATPCFALAKKVVPASMLEPFKRRFRRGISTQK